jgi:hypothetical protein
VTCSSRSQAGPVGLNHASSVGITPCEVVHYGRWMVVMRHLPHLPSWRAYSSCAPGRHAWPCRLLGGSDWISVCLLRVLLVLLVWIACWGTLLTAMGDLAAGVGHLTICPVQSAPNAQPCILGPAALVKHVRICVSEGTHCSMEVCRVSTLFVTSLTSGALHRQPCRCRLGLPCQQACWTPMQKAGSCLLTVVIPDFAPAGKVASGKSCHLPRQSAAGLPLRSAFRDSPCNCSRSDSSRAASSSRLTRQRSPAARCCAGYCCSQRCYPAAVSVSAGPCC